MALLISRRMRRSALAAVLVSWVVVVVLGVLVAGHRHAGAVDRMLIDGVYATVGDRSTLAALLLALSRTAVVGTVVLALTAVALARRRWDVALLAVAAPAIGGATVELVLKPLVGRRLYGDLSYPSGHAVVAVAVYTVAALALASVVTRPWRHVVAAGWGLLTVVVMAGLVGMHWHYPTDTVGGVCVAVGEVLPCALCTDAYLRRRRPTISIPVPRSPVAGPRRTRATDDVRRPSR